MRNFFIYKNPDTLQKSRQFPSRFYIQKARQFRLRDFSWRIWSWHLYTKSMTLCVKWRFYTQKSRQFAKMQDNLRYVFTKKNWTLCVTRFFIEFLILAEGRGDFYMQKTMHPALNFYKQNKMYLALKFYMQKIMHFALSFCIQKYWHFALHFYIQKTMHFALRFISKIYRIVLITNYKRT